MNQDMFGSRGRGRGGGGGGRGFGARGASRGFRGGDRGGRGGFRGGDRGRGGSANFVRSDHGDRGGRGAGRGWGGGRGRGAPFRGNSSRGGESSANRGRVVMGPGPIKYGRGGSSTGERGNRGGQKKSGTKEYLRFEIKAGLQLYITFKSDPVVAELEKLPGFHSITTPHSDKEIIRIILFRDIESLEAARAILDAHENVVSTDHMGLKSSKKQPDAIEKRQVYLRLGKSYSEDAVKQLDSKIEEILPLRENSCKVQYATVEEAEAAVERLKSKIGQNGLQHVDVPYIVQSAKLAIASLQQNQVVLRDVPKSVTLKDIASVFPDAVSFALFDKTFPASKFCHAAIRFKSPNRVAEILKSNDMKIAGKKVYIFPAYMEFLHEYEQLGEAIPEEPAKEVKVKKEEPPAKKRKVENPFADKEAVDEDANGDDEEDSDDEEEGDEEEDDDDDDNEEEEDEEDDEEGEEAAEEEESDESD